MSVLTKRFANRAVTGAGGPLTLACPLTKKWIVTCVTAFDPGTVTNIVQILVDSSDAGGNIVFVLGLVPLTLGYAIKIFDTWTGRLVVLGGESLVYFQSSPVHNTGISVTGFEVPADPP